MIFEEKSVTLKNNEKCILRNARIEDAEDLIQYLKTTAQETPYLVREPEEIKITLEQERKFIQSKIEEERELMLIATVAGRHVGNCSLMCMGNNQRYRHRCGVAIALYQEYCGKGIGRLMLQTILDVAKTCGFEQAELEVVTTNIKAISLYSSLGFQIYGTFPNNMKYKDGTYADTYWMAKRL